MVTARARAPVDGGRSRVRSRAPHDTTTTADLHAAIDAGTAATLADAARASPRTHGIGMTAAQMSEYADVQEYVSPRVSWSRR